jgi:hypothetical protein
VRGSVEHSFQQHLAIDATTRDRAVARRFIDDVRALMATHRVYRGNAITIEVSETGCVSAGFHRLPIVQRDQVAAGPADRYQRAGAGLEPALAARHGRLDRALELDLPDGESQQGSATIVTGTHAERTLAELMDESTPVARSVLGAQPSGPGRSAPLR